jgi:hypothetical protein
MKPFRVVLGHGEIPFPNGSHFIDLQHIDLALITNSMIWKSYLRRLFY